MASSIFLTRKTNHQQAPTLSQLLKHLGSRQSQDWFDVEETVMKKKRNQFGKSMS
jgi:hypothetical protein